MSEQRKMNFREALTRQIRKSIHDAKSDGTVKMSVDNLLQVTRPPGNTLEGAPTGGNLEWQYRQLFREVCESNQTIKSFLLPEPNEIPVNWQDCTRSQLEYLAESGSYGQRLIAQRYIRDWDKDHKEAA